MRLQNQDARLRPGLPQTVNERENRALAPSSMETHKIWLDTDIGSDIDDALALAFLLGRSDCDLLGISTVTEIDNQRAKLASVLCRVAEKDVPIYAGARHSLVVPTPQKTVPQAAALAQFAHQTEFPAPVFAAIKAMRAAIYAHPGEVTLLGIGPLTNLALLFALDPQISRLLKQLVLMCGHFAPPEKSCEWNALNDPHAAAMVYAAPIEKHVSFGLNVTQQLTLTRGEFAEKLEKSRYGAPILAMCDAQLQAEATVTFHDPLAAAAIFEAGLCGYQSGRVAVEIAEPSSLGFTDWTPQPGAAHQIAVSVDAARFFGLYF